MYVVWKTQFFFSRTVLSVIMTSVGCVSEVSERCGHAHSHKPHPLDWMSHNNEYYNCSRYQSNPGIVKERVTTAREALKKYIFYYERVSYNHLSIILSLFLFLF